MSTPDSIREAREALAFTENLITTEDPEPNAFQPKDRYVLAVRQLEVAAQQLAIAQADIVEAAREQGATDRQIGEALGVTKQAVQQRWRRPKPTDADYVQGRAKFTSVEEWAQTGDRLAWRDRQDS